MVDPANLYVISSSVGVLWYSEIIALFKHFQGSVSLVGLMKEFTQDISLICGVMMSCDIFSLSLLLSLFCLHGHSVSSIL